MSWAPTFFKSNCTVLYPFSVIISYCNFRIGACLLRDDYHHSPWSKTICVVLDLLHATTEKTQNLEDPISHKGREARSICASKGEGGGNLPDSCCTGTPGFSQMFLITTTTCREEFQRYCDKTKTDSYTGNRSGKFSRTAFMFMGVLLKKINCKRYINVI